MILHREECQITQIVTNHEAPVDTQGGGRGGGREWGSQRSREGGLGSRQGAG